MTDVLILGAGPAGLSMATALTCHGHPGGVQAVDPAGEWMQAWRRRFAAQDIPMLRSPAVHHPHPDPFALLEHARGQGLVTSGGTQLPTPGLFDRFVDNLIDERGLRDRVLAASVLALTLDGAGRPEVHLSNGEVRRPDRVVLATNSRHPSRPACLAGITDDRIVDAEHADVADTPVDGHLVIVGGGLSAAHLAIGAAHRGAKVTMLTRHRLRVRRFDTHPSWLGPRKRRPFEQEPDPVVRRRTIDTARGGGSIPARIRRELDLCIEAGSITLRERVELQDCEAQGDRLRIVTSDDRELLVDAIWCATGGRIDVAKDPLCSSLLTEAPTHIADGLPELNPDLSWPGTSVHLSGFAAALTLGPTSGNLIGHRRAALRIMASLRGDDPVRADRIATGPGACPDQHQREAPHGSAKTRQPV